VPHIINSTCVVKQTLPYVLSIKSIAASVPPQSKLPNRNARDLAAPHGEI